MPNNKIINLDNLEKFYNNLKEKLYSFSASAQHNITTGYGQGICYVNGYYYITTAAGTVYKIDEETHSIVDTYNNTGLGHANDITYNPTTEHFYICDATFGSVKAGNVYECDNTFSIIATHSLSSLLGIGYGTLVNGIEYYNGNYYVMASKNAQAITDRCWFDVSFFVLDSNFNLIKSMRNIDWNIDLITQGLFIKDDVIFCFSCDRNSSKAYCVCYNINGAYIGETEILGLTGTTKEGECLCYNGTNFVGLINGINAINIYDLDFSIDYINISKKVPQKNIKTKYCQKITTWNGKSSQIGTPQNNNSFISYENGFFHLKISMRATFTGTTGISYTLLSFVSDSINHAVSGEWWSGGCNYLIFIGSKQVKASLTQGKLTLTPLEDLSGSLELISVEAFYEAK